MGQFATLNRSVEFFDILDTIKSMIYVLIFLVVIFHPIFLMLFTFLIITRRCYCDKFSWHEKDRRLVRSLGGAEIVGLRSFWADQLIVSHVAQGHGNAGQEQMFKHTAFVGAITLAAIVVSKFWREKLQWHQLILFE